MITFCVSGLELDLVKRNENVSFAIPQICIKTCYRHDLFLFYYLIFVLWNFQLLCTYEANLSKFASAQRASPENLLSTLVSSQYILSFIEVNIRIYLRGTKQIGRIKNIWRSEH